VFSSVDFGPLLHRWWQAIYMEKCNHLLMRCLHLVAFVRKQQCT